MASIPYADAHYSVGANVRAFYNALSDDGILVMQLGESPEAWHPDETHSKFKNRAAAIRLLEEVGFESIHAYEEVSEHLLMFWLRPPHMTYSFTPSLTCITLRVSCGL